MVGGRWRTNDIKENIFFRIPTQHSEEHADNNPAVIATSYSDQQRFLQKNLLHQVSVPLLCILFFCLLLYSQLPLLYGHARDHGLMSVIARVRNNGVCKKIS